MAVVGEEKAADGGRVGEKEREEEQGGEEGREGRSRAQTAPAPASGFY